MNILLAVDLRTDADVVLSRALPWIERLGATTDLVYVDPYRAMLEIYTPSGFRAELDRVVDDHRRRMDALLAAIPVAYRGRGLLDLADIDEMVRTRTADYDLVVTGTRGLTGLSHLWNGSVAERIVRFSRTSVLVVRDAPVPEHPRILFAVDPTEDAGTLCRTLAPIAGFLRARVDLVTVHEIPVGVPTAFDAPSSLIALLAEQAAADRAAAAERLTGFLLTFPEENRGEVYVDTGPAGAAIVERAAHCDLVVVGTHGRTGIAHAVVGSVAERVVRRSPRPVLVLRPR